PPPPPPPPPDFYHPHPPTPPSVASRGLGDVYKRQVESTTSIACYLLDINLAAEVSRGLLKNEDCLLYTS
ncbi:hypothetical protein QN353_21475, partial [Undibacterium sp. 10I3]|nr:hypothetical protein [Undibacterium sp. 10I3]